MITESRYELKFQDKTLVEMTNVSFSNPVFIDVYNRDSSIIKPSVVISESVFPGQVDIVKDGFNPGSVNKIRVENDHLAEDACHHNSSARVSITGNNLGFMSTGDIQVKGGMMLE